MEPILTSKWTDWLSSMDHAFQPIVNIHTGVCYGFEALLRDYQSCGFSKIEDVFDSAFQDGVLYPVEMCLREKAVKKYASLALRKQYRIFYNLDNRLLDSAEFQASNTKKILEKYRLPYDAICFEISEKHEFCHTGKTFQLLNRYRAQGFKIAVDDCGTGFSGLQLLYYIEPDFIKVDRFFIRDIEKDKKKKLFVSSIVSIAKMLGSMVVAEGVETVQEYFICRDIGCDMLQGNLVQPPEIDISKLRFQYDHIKGLGIGDRRSKSSGDKKLINAEIEYVEPILCSGDMLDVLEKFRIKKENSFFPVLNSHNEPIGVIREAALKDYAYSRYGREVLLNPAFGKNIEKFVSRFPVADMHTPVEKIVEIYSQNEKVEGILIVESMKYRGFLAAHALLKLINEKNLAIAREQNPLTKLPGNTLIHEYVSRSLEDLKTSYVLVYFDFDNFKAFNDTYGFRRGDRVILLFSEILKSNKNGSTRFVGHIGGDDFFMGFKNFNLGQVKSEVTAMAEKFQCNAESFYDQATIQRGFIIANDREGIERRFPLITVSSVLIELPGKREEIYAPEEISNLIARLKKKSKQAQNKMCIATFEGRMGFEFPISCLQTDEM